MEKDLTSDEIRNDIDTRIQKYLKVLKDISYPILAEKYCQIYNTSKEELISILEVQEAILTNCNLENTIQFVNKKLNKNIQTKRELYGFSFELEEKYHSMLYAGQCDPYKD